MRWQPRKHPPSRCKRQQALTGLKGSIKENHIVVISERVCAKFERVCDEVF